MIASSLRDLAIAAPLRESAGNNSIPYNTYITSVSEHNPKKEDHSGRLSMWRAFGNTGATRIALIVKVPPIADTSTQALRIMFNPVAYLTEAEMHDQIRLVGENVLKEESFLRGLPPSIIGEHLFQMFFSAVTCLKHEGFREEREWRIVYNHHLYPSALMERSIETIGPRTENA
jgi:hypothetical protein